MSSTDASENDVVELASSLRTPEVHAATVEASRDDTPTGDNRRLINTVFNNRNGGEIQIGQVTGNVNYHHTPIRIEGHSIFDSLLLREDRFVGTQPGLIKGSKDRYRSTRLVSHSCFHRPLWPI